MNVTISPNPLAPSTSLEVGWSFDDGEPTPTFVTITEFDAAGDQLFSTGQIPALSGGPVLFSQLEPNTTYYYEVCTITPTDAGDLPDCSAWNAYSGTTAAPSPPPPPPPTPTMTITGVQPQPDVLVFSGGAWNVQGNGVWLSWASSSQVFELSIEYTPSSGGPTRGINVSGDEFPASSGRYFEGGLTGGVPYNVQMRGEISQNNYTNWSPYIQAVAPVDFNSVRAFLKASGISGANGIRAFLPRGATSLGVIMGVR